MANPHDRDFVRGYREYDAVIAHSKAKVTLPSSRECFAIAGTGVSVESQCMEDSKGRLTINCPQLRPGRLRPNELHPKPNSLRISS